MDIFTLLVILRGYILNVANRRFRLVKRNFIIMLLAVTLMLIYTYTYLLNVEYYASHNQVLPYDNKLGFLPPVSCGSSKAVLTPPPSVSFSSSIPPEGYLVYNEHCQIPDLDPFHPEIMQYFHRQKPFVTCSKVDPLTHIDFNETTQRYALWIAKDPVKSYLSSAELKCCYQQILRNRTDGFIDYEFSLSKCIDFLNGTQLNPTIDNILVRCRRRGHEVYINGYPLLPKREEIRERLKKWSQSKQNATSVLMIGIDSISRSSLRRSMPKTAQYLSNYNWYELGGYNKVADNTFPNLMAILTGLNPNSTEQKCPGNFSNGLDNCPFIWKTFRNQGYVTSYAEDWAVLNTFNLGTYIGFDTPPVDYYFRPFLLAAEKYLPSKLQSRYGHCLGFKHNAEYVYDYALELVKRYSHDPYFGLFWTSSMSHEEISDSSSMDELMVRYLNKFDDLGTMQNAIVIFFSDHGMRFGTGRKTLSGYLEERLPFIFISLPPHLQRTHPEFVEALRLNKYRLTNPYDLHMTLKHVLQLSGRVEDPNAIAPIEDCPRCQTLLWPVPHNRSCSEIAINDHFCTCIWYERVRKDSKHLVQMSQTAIDYINQFIATRRQGTLLKLCRPLRLAKIESAYQAPHAIVTNETTTDVLELYRINFYTYPNQGLFEATFRYNTSSGGAQVIGDVSRLNTYFTDADCVKEFKLYCSCRKFGIYLSG